MLYIFVIGIISKKIILTNVTPIKRLTPKILCFEHVQKMSEITTTEKICRFDKFDYPPAHNTDENSVIRYYEIFNSNLVEHISKMTNFFDSKNVNYKNSNGDTPLHILIKHNSSLVVYQCFRVLLKLGAKVTTKNNKGETPISLAKENHKQHKHFEKSEKYGVGHQDSFWRFVCDDLEIVERTTF